MFCAVLLGAAAAAQQTPPEWAARTAANQALMRVHEDAMPGLAEKLQDANLQLEWAICERSWKRAPLWKKALRYRLHNPCRRN
jgi:hypothetical protein